jgi:hypothetical protein
MAAPTTSGTVGTTLIDVTTFIEHAYRRAGKLPSTVSSEQQLAARESLFFLLVDLVNDGINLWCINRFVVPLIQGNALYAMPPGLSDILSVAYRTSTVLTGSTLSGVDYSAIGFSVATSPTNVEIAFGTAGIPALVIEYSQDNVTWIQTAQFALQQSTVPANFALAQDIENSPPALFWRDTSGTILPVASITWSNAPVEIPMDPYNRDDYWDLPNKTYQSNRALQYFFDKQINPQIYLWPVPQASTDQVVVQYQRQVQDIGAFTNLVEIPQRWYQYVFYALAELVAMEIPAQELPPGRLELLGNKAKEHNQRASNSESDGAPVKLQPNLRGYTRR